MLTDIGLFSLLALFLRLDNLVTAKREEYIPLLRLLNAKLGFSALRAFDWHDTPDKKAGPWLNQGAWPGKPVGGPAKVLFVDVARFDAQSHVDDCGCHDSTHDETEREHFSSLAI